MGLAARFEKGVLEVPENVLLYAANDLPSWSNEQDPNVNGWFLPSTQIYTQTSPNADIAASPANATDEGTIQRLRMLPTEIPAGLAIFEVVRNGERSKKREVCFLTSPAGPWQRI